MIRKRPELDVVNPPGQWVNPELTAVAYKPVHGGYPASSASAVPAEPFSDAAEYAQRLTHLSRLSPEDLLEELLAVIHGDGGHYSDANGLAKAVAYAEIKWYGNRATTPASGAADTGRHGSNKTESASAVPQAALSEEREVLDVQYGAADWNPRGVERVILAGQTKEVAVQAEVVMLLSPRTCGCKQCDNSCMHD